MATTEWKSDFIESYVNAGAVGDAAAKIVKVLEVRQLQPTERQLARVSECTNLDQLNRWFDRALTAATADEVFQD